MATAIESIRPNYERSPSPQMSSPIADEPSDSSDTEELEAFSPESRQSRSDGSSSPKCSEQILPIATQPGENFSSITSYVSQAPYYPNSSWGFVPAPLQPILHSGRVVLVPYPMPPTPYYAPAPSAPSVRAGPPSGLSAENRAKRTAIEKKARERKKASLQTTTFQSWELPPLPFEPEIKSLYALQDPPPGRAPGYPYQKLIRGAIVGSPRLKLTLAEIYDAIAGRFQYYRDLPDAKWKRSVRHCLSNNPQFMRVPKLPSDPGHGDHWTINPEVPQGAARIRNRRKGTPTREDNPPKSTCHTAPPCPASEVSLIAPSQTPNPFPHPTPPSSPPLHQPHLEPFYPGIHPASFDRPSPSTTVTMEEDSEEVETWLRSQLETDA